MKPSLITITLLLAMQAFATKYAPPEPKEIYSENKAFYVIIAPASNKQLVFAADRKEPLWKFSYSSWHDEIFVSDDGNRIVIVKWKHFKDVDAKSAAIQVINRGKIEREYSYDQLCSPRKRGDREVGPIGDFWRIWKEKPTSLKDQKLTVTVAGGKPVVIDLSTGKKL